jgi:hypothetical protein
MQENELHILKHFNDVYKDAIANANLKVEARESVDVSEINSERGEGEDESDGDSLYSINTMSFEDGLASDLESSRLYDFDTVCESSRITQTSYANNKRTGTKNCNTWKPNCLISCTSPSTSTVLFDVPGLSGMLSPLQSRPQDIYYTLEDLVCKMENEMYVSPHAERPEVNDSPVASPSEQGTSPSMSLVTPKVTIGDDLGSPSNKKPKNRKGKNTSVFKNALSSLFRSFTKANVSKSSDCLSCDECTGGNSTGTCEVSKRLSLMKSYENKRF